MGPENDNKRLAHLDDESIRNLLESLIDWRQKSDPTRGSSSESQKHYNAQQTIFFTGLLVESLCAWAFDHFIGTVKEGPVKVPSLGEADDHRFELSGRNYEPGDPSTDRQILSLLISMGGVVPLALRHPLVRAFHALDAGEAVDLVRPASTGMWRSPYSLAELRLCAVNHVFMMWGGGMTKKKGQGGCRRLLRCQPTHTAILGNYLAAAYYGAHRGANIRYC